MAWIFFSFINNCKFDYNIYHAEHRTHKLQAVTISQ